MVHLIELVLAGLLDALLEELVIGLAPPAFAAKPAHPSSSRSHIAARYAISWGCVFSAALLLTVWAHLRQKT